MFDGISGFVRFACTCCAQNGIYIDGHIVSGIATHLTRSLRFQEREKLKFNKQNELAYFTFFFFESHFETAPIEEKAHISFFFVEQIGFNVCSFCFLITDTKQHMNFFCLRAVFSSSLEQAFRYDIIIDNN